MTHAGQTSSVTRCNNSREHRKAKETNLVPLLFLETERALVGKLGFGLLRTGYTPTCLGKDAKPGYRRVSQGVN